MNPLLSHDTQAKDGTQKRKNGIGGVAKIQGGFDLPGTVLPQECLDPSIVRLGGIDMSHQVKNTATTKGLSNLFCWKDGSNREAEPQQPRPQ